MDLITMTSLNIFPSHTHTLIAVVIQFFSSVQQKNSESLASNQAFRYTLTSWNLLVSTYVCARKSTPSLRVLDVRKGIQP